MGSEISTVVRDLMKPSVSATSRRQPPGLHVHGESSRAVLERRIRRRFKTRIRGEREPAAIGEESTPNSSPIQAIVPSTSSASSHSVTSERGKIIAVPSHAWRSVCSLPTRSGGADSIDGEPSLWSEDVEETVELTDLVLPSAAEDSELLDVEKRFQRLVKKQQRSAATAHPTLPASSNPNTSSLGDAELGDILREELGVTSGGIKRNTNKDFACGVCSQKFASMQSKLRHARRKHPDCMDVAVARRLAPLDLVQNPFQCGTCFKSFSSATVLSSHRRRHDDSARKFRCNFCPNRSYVLRSELNKHLKRAHGIGKHDAESRDEPSGKMRIGESPRLESPIIATDAVPLDFQSQQVDNGDFEDMPDL